MCEPCRQASSPVDTLEFVFNRLQQFDVKINKWAKPGIIYLLDRTLFIAPQDWELDLEDLGKLPVVDLGRLMGTRKIRRLF